MLLNLGLYALVVRPLHMLFYLIHGFLRMRLRRTTNIASLRVDIIHVICNLISVLIFGTSDIRSNDSNPYPFRASGETKKVGAKLRCQKITTAKDNELSFKDIICK